MNGQPFDKLRANEPSKTRRKLKDPERITPILTFPHQGGRP